jgi:hypothetical protein
MSDVAKIRAQFELLNTQGVQELRARLESVKAMGPEVAAALGRGEISAKEADAEFKILASTAKNLESALRGLEAAQAGLASEQEEAAQESARDARATAAAEAASRDAVDSATAAIERLTTAKRIEASATEAGQKAALTADEQRYTTAIQAEEQAIRREAEAARLLMAQLDALAVEGAQVSTEFARGDISAEQFAREMTHLEAEAKRLRGDLDAMTTAQGRMGMASTTGAQSLDKIAKASTAAASSGRNLGLGCLEISRAVEDAQYGLNGVLNNLPNIVSMFGGPAGLAAGVSIAAVAMYTLRGAIRELLSAFDQQVVLSFGSSIASVKKRLEELTEKPHKLDVDYSRIDEARKLLEVMESKLAAFKAISGQTDTQEKVGKAVTHLIREEAGGTDEVGGKENLEKLLAATADQDFVNEAIRTSQTDKGKQIRGAEERLKQLREMKPESLEEAQAIGLQINSTIESIAKLRHDLTDIIREKVDQVIGGAAKGIERDRKAIADAFDRNRRLFEQGDQARGIAPVAPTFRAGLDDAQGSQIKLRERAAERSKEQGDRLKRATDAANKAQDDVDKEVKRVLDDELEILKRSGQIEEAGKRLTAEVAKSGLKGEAAFLEVSKRLDAEIHRMLDAGGFKPPVGREAVINEAVGDLSVQAAGGARIAAETEKRKADKQEDTAESKAWKAELAEAQKELNAELKETERRNKAEADRIQEAYGKPVVDRFAAGIASQPGADPQALARQQTAQLAQYFTTRQGGGATRGGAEQAAREIARQAGFEVTHEDFRDAIQEQLAQAQPRRRQQRTARQPARPAAPSAPPAETLANLGAAAIPVLGQAVQTAARGTAATQATLNSQQAALTAMQRLQAEEERLAKLANDLARQYQGIGTRLNNGRR